MSMNRVQAEMKPEFDFCSETEYISPTKLLNLIVRKSEFEREQSWRN